MRKKIFVLTLALVLAASYFSGIKAASKEIFTSDTESESSSPVKFGFGINADFTTVSMGDVNTLISDAVDNFGSGGAIVSSSHISNGFLVDASFNIMLTAVPGLSFGPKIGYLYVFPGNIKANADWSGNNSDYNGTMTWDLNSSMIPILIGASYNAQLPNSGLTLGGSLYFGVALANTEIKSTFVGDQLIGSDQQVFNFDIPYSGSCPMLDINANIGLAVTDSLKLLLNLGYRVANVSQMTADQEQLGTFFGDIHTGDTAKDWYGNTLQFDYSGIILGVEADYTF